MMLKLAESHTEPLNNASHGARRWCESRKTPHYADQANESDRDDPASQQKYVFLIRCGKGQESGCQPNRMQHWRIHCNQTGDYGEGAPTYNAAAKFFIHCSSLNIFSKFLRLLST
jgi:hypothetical protein